MSRALTILVTGAAGRIGRAAVRELVARGHRVRAFDVVAATGTDDVIVGNITDPEAVQKAVQGVDVLIHLAATPDDDDFLERLLPNNLIGAYHVLEASRLAGVRRMVLGSSGQVVWWQRFTGPLPVTADATPTPKGWYAATKLFQEAAGRAFAGAIRDLGHCGQTGVVSARPSPRGRAGTYRLGARRLLEPGRCRPFLRLRGRGPGEPSIRSGLCRQPPGPPDHLRPDARPRITRLRAPRHLARGSRGWSLNADAKPGASCRSSGGSTRCNGQLTTDHGQSPPAGRCIQPLRSLHSPSPRSYDFPIFNHEARNPAKFACVVRYQRAPVSQRDGRNLHVIGTDDLAKRL